MHCTFMWQLNAVKERAKKVPATNSNGYKQREVCEGCIYFLPLWHHFETDLVNFKQPTITSPQLLSYSSLNAICYTECCMLHWTLYMLHWMLYATLNAICYTECCMLHWMLYATLNAVCYTECYTQFSFNGSPKDQREFEYFLAREENKTILVAQHSNSSFTLTHSHTHRLPLSPSVCSIIRWEVGLATSLGLLSQRCEIQNQKLSSANKK